MDENLKEEVEETEKDFEEEKNEKTEAKTEKADGKVEDGENIKEKTENKAKEITQREIIVNVSKADDFKRVYSIGAMGIHNIYDFRLSFYNDEPAISNQNVREFKRVIETEIILSPVAARDLAMWLNKNLEEYEQKFGPIKKLPIQLFEGKKTQKNKNKEKNNEICEFGMDGYA